MSAVLSKLSDNIIVREFLNQIEQPIRYSEVEDKFYEYRHPIWFELTSLAIGKNLVHFFKKHEADYNDPKINRLVALIKKEVPIFPSQNNYVGIPFINIIYNPFSQQLCVHKEENYLTNCLPYEFLTMPNKTPCFDTWIAHCSEGNHEISDVIKAALYMCLANRYEWQLFLEVQGKANTGKSIFTQIAELLVGEKNVAATSLHALEKEKFNSYLVNKSLILANDEDFFKGSAPTLKRIVGNDTIRIEEKNARIYSSKITAIFVMTDNQPAMFSHDNGGIARRRILISFNNVVTQNNIDEHLIIKIKKEIASIAAKLLTLFKDEQQARSILLSYQRSEIPESIKIQQNSLYAFAKNLSLSKTCNGLYIGSKKTFLSEVQNNLYLLYEKYCEYYNRENLFIASNKFFERLSSALIEVNPQQELRKISKNNKTITNAHVIPMSELATL